MSGKDQPLTRQQAADLAGRSISWLARHQCAWCGQTCLNSIRYGCAAIDEKCEPRKKSYGPETAA